MKNILNFWVLILLSSCSLFKTATLSRDIHKVADNVCMHSEGKGRLTVKNQKYIFTYESFLEEDRARWVLTLDFPLRSEETFELDWSKNGKMHFKSTIDTKILRENKEVDPKEIDLFVSSIGHFLKDIIKLRTQSKEKLANKWKLDKKSLIGQSRSKRSEMLFTNLNSEKYFGLMSVSYKGNDEQSYKMDFIVRKCFKNQVSDSDMM